MRKREIEFDKLREQLQACLREPAAIIATHSHAENAFDVQAIRASLPRAGSSATDALLSSEDEEQLRSGVAAMNGAPTEAEQLDRLELLEHENANMRQLLASVNQILAEMRATALHLVAGPEGGESDANLEARDLTTQINTLPVVWIYEQVKEEIETSLAVLSDLVRSQ